MIGYYNAETRAITTIHVTPLYSMKPAGIGTPMVESLTCYTMRLASAHGVTVV